MYIEPKLKPLFANLKRLKVGNYLYSEEFKLFMLENNLDEFWEECKEEGAKKYTFINTNEHNIEIEEEAFLYFISGWYENNYSIFHEFIIPFLLNFASWSKTKLDYVAIIENIRNIRVSDQNVKDFSRKFNEIQQSKPLKIIEQKLNIDSVPKPMGSSRKIFVVHGHDDTSRLELCRILKDEFNLEPVVLSEKPNNSIETIIGKFERLASECSAAVVLFTPDDTVDINKRSRQNVIFELGYFLGKFQETNPRHIIILKKGNIEIPSDINGVLYLEFNTHVKEIFYDLKKQFDYWGY